MPSGVWNDFGLVNELVAVGAVGVNGGNVDGCNGLEGPRSKLPWESPIAEAGIILDGTAVVLTE
jgi:hypothetical protein